MDPPQDILAFLRQWSHPLPEAMATKDTASPA